jgi:uncharacterized repeat protein (TIGR03806 family)
MRLLVAALWLVGCSNSATKKSMEDGGTPDLSVEGVNDLSAEGESDLLPPPPLSPWGIDSRPANATCIAPARPVSVTLMDIGVQAMFPNLALDSPIAVYRNKLTNSASEPMRWFVLERGGKVWTFVDPNASKTPTGGQEQAQLFFSIGVDTNGEGGLLSIAFDPQFQTNHHIYLNYTGGNHCTLRTSDTFCENLSRCTVTQNLDGTFTEGAEEVIFTFGHPFSNHDGGDIAFGPDGYLYVGYGDGGSGGDPQCSGQTLKSPMGKILRIDPRSVGSGYAVPPDNPFPSPGAANCFNVNLDSIAARTQNCPEIYAWGMRNPWRWSFDSVPPVGSGPGLWVGDVGQDLIEEVDFVEKGKNYGWNRREGLSSYSTSCTPADTNYVDPKVQYQHNGIARSITGGFIYRGTAIPALAGAYIFGDYGTGGIYAIKDAYNITSTVQNPTPIYTLSNSQLVGFGEDEDHELYAVAFGGTGSSIFKIVPAIPPMQENTFPQKLSQTGCVNPSDPTQAASGLIAYEVNAPLWSDGADKRRWLSIPDGTQIHVGSDGHWQLPIGSVLMKEFSLNGQRLETRLLVHHDDGDWAGYTYVWDDTGVDATLIDGRQQKVVGSQTWTFPGRADCLACHTTAAGRSLGPDTRQFNRDIIYPDGRYANQIATLVHLGMFDAPFPDSAGFVSYTGSAPIETRVRTYLHANCAHCHRPGSTASNSTAMNLLFDTPLAQMNACGVTPTQGNLGISGALLLTPGSTASSLVSVRMHATDIYRMPQVGSNVVDPTGTSVVDAWISSLTSCP